MNGQKGDHENTKTIKALFVTSCFRVRICSVVVVQAFRPAVSNHAYDAFRQNCSRAAVIS